MAVPHNQIKVHINAAISVATQRVAERTEELFSSEIASSGQPTTLKTAHDKPIGRVRPLGEFPSHDILPLPTGPR